MYGQGYIHLFSLFCRLRPGDTKTPTATSTLSVQISVSACLLRRKERRPFGGKAVLGLGSEVPLALPLGGREGPCPPGQEAQAAASHGTRRTGVMGVKLKGGWTWVLVRT